MTKVNLFKISHHNIKTMLRKKKCKNCGEKIKNNYEFCPNCGFQIRKSKKQSGMLGRNDYIENEPAEMPSMFGGISGGMLNKMLGSAMKMLEKEIKKGVQEIPKQQPNARIKLMINGKEITPSVKRVEKQDKTPLKTLPINFSLENLKKFKKLQKKEPKTQIRRLGDRLTYELEIPGVDSIKDVSIIKIDKGIEVKALAKKKAYEKTISIDLPLTKYMLLKGKLFLELDTKE